MGDEPQGQSRCCDGTCRRPARRGEERMKSRTPISDELDSRMMSARNEMEAADIAGAILVSHEQMESDAMTPALRLYGEDDSTFSPECYEVMRRWRPMVEAIL